MALLDVQETPNPRARRFMVDHVVQDAPRGRSFTQPDDEGADEVVASILKVPGVHAVLTLPSSVTVTIREDADWQDVTPQVSVLLAGRNG